jgi:4-amino-4-deoxy-L-arabinose transferase-like glycosyltransferase
MSPLSEKLTPLAQSAAQPWRWMVLAALLLAFYFGVGVFDHDIWAPTEPTVAGVVWEMYTSGDLAVPRIDGYPYLEKPPFYYWCARACCKAAGHISAGLLRLPSAVFGVLCLFLAFYVARARFGAAAAWLAVVLAATTPQFFILSHRATADMAATFFTFLCFALFASTLSASDETPKRHHFDILLALALALSFYSKNFFTWLVVLPPVLLFLAYKRLYGRIAVILGLLALFFVLFVTPWCAVLFHRAGRQSLQTVFVDNTVGRFFNLAPTGPMNDPLNDAWRAEKGNSRFIYLISLFIFAAPWLLAFIASIPALFMKRRDGDFRLFLKIAFIEIPVVLSLSSSRVPEYLMPIYFVTILMTADLLCDLLPAAARGPQDWKARLVGLNVALVVGGSLAIPAFAAVVLRSALPLLGLLPGFAAAVWLLAHRREWFSFRVLSTSLAVVCAALMFLIVCITPTLDQHKSFAYFFDAIRPVVAQRKVYSAFYDDRRLPLICYYLDRRVETVEEERIFELLGTRRPLGIILSPKFYEAHLQEFTGAFALSAPRGKNVFTLVMPGTDPSLPADSHEGARISNRGRAQSGP